MVGVLLGYLASFQEKYPLIVLLITLLASGILLFYGMQIQTDSSVDRMYPADSQTLQLNDIMRSQFGSTDVFYVLIAIDEGATDRQAVNDIRDPSVVESAHLLAQRLREESNVESVTSLADVYLDVYGYLPQTLNESKMMLSQLATQGDVSGLITDDYTKMNMIISVNVENKVGAVEAVEAVFQDKVLSAQIPHGVEMTLTGSPSLVNRIISLLIGDNINTVALALLGVFVILWVYFRNPFVAAATVLPVVLTLVWLTGSMFLLDIKITMMVASVGAMMVGMGVDYSLHVSHAYQQAVKQGDKQATKSTVVGVGGALFASVLTTLAGFAAMMLGDTPNSQTQGQVLAMGILFAFTASLIVLPAVLVVLRKLQFSKLDEILFTTVEQEEKRPNPLVRFLGEVAAWQARAPVFILIGAGIFTFLLLPGITLVYMDTDSENWVPSDDPVAVSLDEIGNNFGGIESQNFLVMLTDTPLYVGGNPVVDLRDPRLLQPLADLQNSFEAIPIIDSVDSPIAALKEHNDGKIPQDIDTVKQIMRQHPEINSHYNDDYSIMTFTATGQQVPVDVYLAMKSEIETVPLPEEVVIAPQGGHQEDEELMALFGADTVKTTLLGFLFVIVIATLLYRSFVVGMLAFIPIIFAIVWTVCIMGYVGLPFTVLTSGMLAILMGIGIDFSIHIIHKARSLLDAGKGIAYSLRASLTSTGEAISISTLTTIVGFMALGFASLLGTQRLGYTLAIGIGSTFISCMLIVPSSLALQYNLKRRNKDVEQTLKKNKPKGGKK